MNLRKVLVMALLFSAVVFSQSVNLKVNAGSGIHLKDKQTNDFGPYAGVEMENPSIASYFEDGSLWLFDISIRFARNEDRAGLFFIGLNYEYGKNDIRIPGDGPFIGETLTMKNYTPYLGYGIFLDDEEKYAFLYGYGGIVLRNYSGYISAQTFTDGENTISLEGDAKYDTGAAFRFGFGLDFENIKDSVIGFSLGAYFNFGSVTWKETDYKQGSSTLVKYTPDGSSELTDNMFVIHAGLNIIFDFSTDEN